MDGNPLTFVHLSDIHFQKRSGDSLDLDTELRSELENDLKRMKDELNGISGILVSGDIAYSGHPEEYSRALEWLGKLCDILIGERSWSQVWVVPGNHDAYQDKVINSKPIRDQHNRLRSINNPKELELELQATLQDNTYSKLLLEPIEDYIKFAGIFSCSISPENPCWQHDIKLNDGSTLKLHGLNSALISDKDDNNRDKKVILGQHQVIFQGEPFITYLTICHHPPDWLLDGENIKKMLLARSHVQLFGHKHSQFFEQIKNGLGNETLIISAGAVHPERNNLEWSPRYNVFSILVEGTGNSRHLKVIVFPRVWNDNKRVFDADLPNSSISIEFTLPLPPWEGLKESEQIQEPLMENRTDRIDKEEKLSVPVESPTDHIADPARSLAYRFLTLQYHQIMSIATQLELLTDDDEGLLDFELYKNLFKRAKEKDFLAKLWDLVEKEHDDQYSSENPFKTHKT